MAKKLDLNTILLLIVAALLGFQVFSTCNRSGKFDSKGYDMAVEVAEKWAQAERDSREQAFYRYDSLHAVHQWRLDSLKKQATTLKKRNVQVPINNRNLTDEQLRNRILEKYSR